MSGNSRCPVIVRWWRGRRWRGLREFIWRRRFDDPLPI
jgi:hypothetical protein